MMFATRWRQALAACRPRYAPIDIAWSHSRHPPELGQRRFPCVARGLWCDSGLSSVLRAGHGRGVSREISEPSSPRWSRRTVSGARLCKLNLLTLIPRSQRKIARRRFRKSPHLTFSRWLLKRNKGSRSGSAGARNIPISGCAWSSKVVPQRLPFRGLRFATESSAWMLRHTAGSIQIKTGTDATLWRTGHDRPISTKTLPRKSGVPSAGRPGGVDCIARGSRLAPAIHKVTPGLRAGALPRNAALRHPLGHSRAPKGALSTDRNNWCTSSDWSLRGGWRSQARWLRA